MNDLIPKKREYYTDRQRMAILDEQHETGCGVMEICKKYHISDGSFYTWRQKFRPERTAGGAMRREDVPDAPAPRWETNEMPTPTYDKQPVSALELENLRLKAVIADLYLAAAKS